MDPYRLPRHVVPLRYDLFLEPDLSAFTFTGEATIALEVREATQEILLNAAELSVSSADARQENGTIHQASVTLDDVTERCCLTFARTLSPGAWRLRLVFQGTLNDKLRGFYRSSYKDAAGTTHMIAATQFEATDARRAFPCWDEPDFKAVFATTLTIPRGLTALSNTRILEETPRGDKQIVRFADSIPMSSYLVAFVVGELEATAPVMVGTTPLRVWCVPGKTHLASLALDIGAFSLRLFEEYYGQPYPGDKLDLIALPDFASGAMENFGAITFRETALLVDGTLATHAERERVADVVAHENAHMWFGDLVTMSWWNGLWLNEAFATFVEMVAVDAWKPQWQRWTTFGVSRSAALTVDGLRSTRPIEFPVTAPRDADAMFDVLTYEKGASVLRMLEQYLGDSVFREGVRLYLERHKFGNAETGDLWAALGEAAHQPIPQIMDAWVFRPGYPIVHVRREGDNLVLRQQRFSYLPPTEGDGKSSPLSLWKILIQVRLRAQGQESVQRLLLEGEELRVALPAATEAVVVNEGGHGFYRVRYQPDLLECLLSRLPEGLEPIERFNLLNDAWAAVLAQLMPLGEYLDLTTRFHSERDRNVWSVLIASLHAINRILDDRDRPSFARLVRHRLSEVWNALGWEPKADESELTRQLRGDLLRAVGVLGDEGTVQARAAEVYAQYRAHAAGLDPDVWSAVIAILGHAGDAARYDEFLTCFRSARTPQDEQRFLYALAAFRDPQLVDQHLQRTLNGEIRTQDAPLLIRSMLMAPHSREATWAFVQKNWPQMARTYPLVGLRRLFEGVIGLVRPEWEAQVIDFAHRHTLDFGGKTLAQYLEQLRVAVALREREGASLRSRFADSP